jgi:hypothetical protein
MQSLNWLHFYEHIIDVRDEYDNYISKSVLSRNEIIDRYKAEDSFITCGIGFIYRLLL